MADSNKVVVAVGEESTWGSVASSMTQLPIVSGSMTESPSTVRSQQLRTDAQFAGTKRTGIEATAQFEVELQGDNLDTLLRAALRNGSSNDWSNVDIDTTCSGTEGWDTGNTAELTLSGVTGLVAGQWIYVSGTAFGSAGSVGWFQIASIAGNTVTVTSATQPTVGELPSSGTFNVKGDKVRNGADLTSFTLQAQYSDLTNEYRRMTGARITSLGVSATAQSIMTGSVGFGGKRVTRESSTAASVTAATENEVMSEVDSFDGFWIDGAEEANYSLTSVNLNIAASGRPLRGLGALENKAMQLGPLEVTGSIEMYLDATTYQTWLPKLSGFTSFSLGFAVNDGLGHRYFFFLPKCKLTSEAGNIPGIDQDVMLTMDFSAEPDTIGSETKTIEIVRAV